MNNCKQNYGLVGAAAAAYKTYKAINDIVKASTGAGLIGFEADLAKFAEDYCANKDKYQFAEATVKDIATVVEQYQYAEEEEEGKEKLGEDEIQALGIEFIKQLIAEAEKNEEGTKKFSWSEKDHPRGNPDNPGQFTSGGGGGKKEDKKKGVKEKKKKKR